jgi:hypothetical protein
MHNAESLVRPCGNAASSPSRVGTRKPGNLLKWTATSAPEPSPWRRQETLAQREHKDLIEDCGSWVGV